MKSEFCWLLERIVKGRLTASYLTVVDGEMAALTTDPYKAEKFFSRQEAEAKVADFYYEGLMALDGVEFRAVEHGFEYPS